MVFTDYFGFYLGKVSDESNKTLYHVACFKDRGDSRQVVKVPPKDDNLEASYGELIQFETEAEELDSTSVCSFKRLAKPLFEHKKDEVLIIHIADNFSVSAANCKAAGEFQHIELGVMRDRRHLMFPGSYQAMMFTVAVEGDTFTFDVIQTLRADSAVTPPEDDTIDLCQRFKDIGKVIKDEVEHVISAENKIWNAIGKFKVVALDTSQFFTGTRPIFELVDTDNLPLLKNISAAAQVFIKKLKLNAETNEWEDDNSFREIFAVFFRAGKESTQCYATLSSDARYVIEDSLAVGDMVRFESSQSMEDVKYWETGKQGECGIFLHTTKNNDGDMKLQDVLEEHMIATDTINKIRDKGHRRSILNGKQLKAIQMARNEDRPLVMIQGPPGTGKTFVLANYLCSLILDGKAAMVLTPTKEAMRNIRKKTKEVMKSLRVPYQRNTLMNLQRLQQRLEEEKPPKELTDKMESWHELVKNGKMEIRVRNKLIQEAMKSLKQERIAEIMVHTRVVFSTICSSFPKMLVQPNLFDPDVCVIDEASQVMEAQTWPACCRMKRIVMAGDPKQLPAIVFSEEARKFDLGSSVMDRIINDKDRFSWIMLEEQYRSNPAINQWSNQSFYGGSLKAACIVPVLTDMFEHKPRSNIMPIYSPFVMIDTSLETDAAKRVALYEQIKSNNKSGNPRDSDHTYENKGEAQLVITHFKKLIEHGIPEDAIAIITPYRGQLELVQSELAKEKLSCSVGTVDSFQGQEFEVVIFSMVRSNPRLDIGFVADLRRLNVAITRAKKHFCFVGNGFMLFKNRNEQIKNLFAIFKNTYKRFPPCFVSHVCKPFDKEKVTNNFGLNFQLFLDHTNDERMKKFCTEYVENAPEFKILRQRRENNMERYKPRNDSQKESKNETNQ